MRLVCGWCSIRERMLSLQKYNTAIIAAIAKLIILPIEIGGTFDKWIVLQIEMKSQRAEIIFYPLSN